MVPDHGAEPIERKIQLAGNSTFVVSLPKEWAVERNLERGASVNLYPRRDRVIVAPASIDVETRSRTVEATSLEPRAIAVHVRSAYLAGEDRIEVVDPTGLDPEVSRAVRSAVAQLVGVAVTDEAADRIVVRDMLDPGDVSLAQTIAQLRRLTLETHRDAVRAVTADDGSLSAAVAGRDADADRLFAFVARGFRRGLEDVAELGHLDVDRSTAFRRYRVARSLRCVVGQAAGIADVADRQSAPPEDEVASRLSEATADARSVVVAGLDGESDRAHELESQAIESAERLDRTLSDADDPDVHLYGSALEHVRRTATRGVDIASVATARSPRS